jgi:hypothetical protein
LCEAELVGPIQRFPVWDADDRELVGQARYNCYGFGQRGVFFIDNTISGTISGASGALDTKWNTQVITLGLKFPCSF